MDEDVLKLLKQYLTDRFAPAKFSRDAIAERFVATAESAPLARRG